MTRAGAVEVDASAARQVVSQVSVVITAAAAGVCLLGGLFLLLLLGALGVVDGHRLVSERPVDQKSEPGGRRLGGASSF